MISLGDKDEEGNNGDLETEGYLGLDTGEQKQSYTVYAIRVRLKAEP